MRGCLWQDHDADITSELVGDPWQIRRHDPLPAIDANGDAMCAGRNESLHAPLSARRALHRYRLPVSEVGHQIDGRCCRESQRQDANRVSANSYDQTPVVTRGGFVPNENGSTIDVRTTRHADRQGEIAHRRHAPRDVGERAAAGDHNRGALDDP